MHLNDLPARRPAAAMLVAVLAGSCATTNLPPISATGPDFQPARDERRLWDEARAQEHEMLGRITLYDDPLLRDYLSDVTERLESPGLRDNPALRLRVRVIDEPTANAFAFPHGALYVHTGLLARLESEDQLAMVLGHEMTHVENRHMLRLQRRARNRQIALLSAAIGLSILLGREQAEAADRGRYGKAATIGVLADVVVGLGLGLVFLAAINGYGRELEAEADEGGFDKLRAAGYDVEEGARVYEILLEDAPEPGSKVEQYFFSNHPALEERVASAREYLASHPEANRRRGPSDPTRFARRIRPLLRRHVGQLVEAGEIERAEAAVERLLDIDPEDPDGLRAFAAVRAERARTAADPDARRALREEALAALERAAAAQPENPEILWELGVAAYRADRRGRACNAFRCYLEGAPDGEHAGRARDYLRELELDGACEGASADCAHRTRQAPGARRPWRRGAA